MRVLVTGGTGFVGSHLIEALRAAGDTVRALVRPSGNRQFLDRLGAEPVVGDIERPETLAAACLDRDVVYHAAARVDIVGSEADFRRTTVAGTEALLRCAREAGVRRFVYVGSCAVFHPRMLRRGVIREDTPIEPPPRWFRYGLAKLAAEQAVRTQLDPGQEWAIIRLGYVYGPRNRAMHQYLRPMLSHPEMRLIGRGDNEMAMIHVRDAARAIVAAGRVPDAAGRVLIAVGAEHVTQRDFFDGLADGFGVPRVTKRAPYALAYALAWLAEKLQLKHLNGSFQRAGVALTGLPQRINCDATRALLQWEPQIPFADGIREACEWYRAEHAAPDGA